MISISFIATSKYKEFFPTFYKGVTENFCSNEERMILVSTDDPDNSMFKMPNVITKKISHAQWPYITLHRFKYLLNFKQEIGESSHFFFIDADLIPVSKIELSDLAESDKDLVGVQHPGFIGKIGTFETNTNSLASIFHGRYDLSHYRQGCFWGGESKSVIEMIEELDRRVDVDLSNGVIARWHDESHMNKYFVERNERVLTLHPGYAQPEFGYEEVRSKFPTKMIHLAKDDSKFPRHPGGPR